MLFVKEKNKSTVARNQGRQRSTNRRTCNINESLYSLWTQKASQTNEQVSDNYLYESGIECENFQGR